MRLIDVDALSFEKLQDTHDKAVPIKEYIAYLRGASDVEDIVRTAPTIDAEPVIHAHWIKSGRSFDYDITCSHCGYVYYGIETDQELNDYNYCNKCGAKMDKKNTKER